MKILVTGSDGLVGRAVRRIAEQHPDHEYVFATRKTCDLTDRGAVFTLFEDELPDVVVHLAAKVGGLFYNLANHTEMYRANVEMNSNIIDASVAYGVVKCFVCLSTCIFPDTEKGEFTEADLHMGAPHWSNYGYAVAKRYAEVLASKYMDHDKCATSFHFLAPTNLYGPEDNFRELQSHVVPALIRRAHTMWCSESDSGLSVRGDGTPLRQFLYVDDLAKILMTLVEEAGPLPRTMIVAPSEEYTIRQLAETVCDAATLPKISLVFTGGANGQARKYASNSLLMSLPCMKGFEFTSLGDGIARTMHWYSTHLTEARN